MPRVRGGWLVDATGILQTTVAGGGLAFLNGASLLADGTVCAATDAAQPRTVLGGLAYDSASNLIMDQAAAIANTLNGLPLTSTGAIAASSNAVALTLNGLGFDSGGRLCVAGLPLLSILPGGPQASQVATGSLTAATGQTVSCSRASSAWCLQTNGFYTLLGNNTVIVEPSGLRVEGVASTNQCLQNRDFTQAVWTKTTMTAAKTATGVDNVASSASTLTATGASATVTQSITLAVNTDVLSLFIKRRTGTGTIKIALDNGTTPVDVTSQINSSTFTRVFTSLSVTNPVVWIQIVTSGDAIDVDLAQLEIAPANAVCPSSPITTTAAAATRAAEAVTVPNPLNGLSQPVSPLIRASAKVNPSFGTWAQQGALFQALLNQPVVYGSVNSWVLYFKASATTSIGIDTYDAAIAEKFRQVNVTPSAGAHTVTGTVASAGALTISFDGVDQGGADGGAGTGIVAAENATLNIGNESGGTGPLSGFWLTDIIVTNS